MSVHNKHSSFFKSRRTPEVLRTRDDEDISGSEALCSLLFQAVRSASYTHRRYSNYVREIGDPLTRGLRTRDDEDISGSEALCSLLFQAVRSASYTHRRYANYVREDGDPLTRGLRTRDDQDTSGSEALCSLLFHAFRSKRKRVSKHERSHNGGVRGSLNGSIGEFMLGWASPLGRTSMTQEFDGQLAALELACAKATFPWATSSITQNLHLHLNIS
ncbi:hypothetical protein CRE_23033 [Caenorhabditis remanei]|uniref:Uncharacterized protein n=1 Tax=Caenorhabditis remanei TaxID=31234 RepID=E3N4G7_CAERE|nr:hypothetical protein CRE_23033 [Caenorhabditis remanei]